MKTVFLSASVPRPDRDKKYFTTADVVAIRDCIKALVTVLLPEHRLAFGAHPAITPLVKLLADAKGRAANEQVFVFASSYFEKDFSEDLKSFGNLRVTPMEPGNLPNSLAMMRREMISAFRYDAAVFVGGMDGVEEEYRIFRETYPMTPTYPIASTGAAAAILFKEHQSNDVALQHELTYATLFRNLILRSERPKEH